MANRLICLNGEPGLAWDCDVCDDGARSMQLISGCVACNGNDADLGRWGGVLQRGSKLVC